MKKLSIFPLFALVFLLLAGQNIQAPQANAYTLMGCKWPSATKAIKIGTSLSAYVSSLNDAISAWNALSDFTITQTTGTSSFTATVISASGSGYDGATQVTCSSGYFSNVVTMLNTSTADTFVHNKKRAIWTHELGHSLGLDHVSSNYFMMYYSPANVYNTHTYYTPMSDDVNGVNFLY